MYFSSLLLSVGVLVLSFSLSEIDDLMQKFHEPSHVKVQCWSKNSICLVYLAFSVSCLIMYSQDFAMYC